MSQFTPLRNLPSPGEWSSKDVMVVFGELFNRGYANGIVDLAKSKGMKVIYSTVGRRDDQNKLRPLTNEELKDKELPLINIPLEAGFDLEPASNGISPVEQLKGVKMSEWNNVKFDWNHIEESRNSAVENFRSRASKYLAELEKEIPEDSNIIFVHTMAGGFPRAKVVMPVTNKVFKGFGDRFCSSESFWKSDIGKFCDINFKEVTGQTLFHLIDLTANLRKKYEDNNKKVSYVAYGYHGTDILLGDKYQWQSYSPYLQGWAKIHLEEVAKKAFNNNVKCSVFNSPEILTNSSSIFLGVEVSLYQLLGALKKEGLTHPVAQETLSNCQSLLKEDVSIDDVLGYCTKYFASDTIEKSYNFEDWPQHSSNEQMKLMRESSSELINMHKDSKQLITSTLSEVVFKACGKIMLNEAWSIQQPVWWIGHDAVTKQSLN